MKEKTSVALIIVVAVLAGHPLAGQVWNRVPGPAGGSVRPQATYFDSTFYDPHALHAANEFWDNVHSQETGQAYRTEYVLSYDQKNRYSASPVVTEQLIHSVNQADWLVRFMSGHAGYVFLGDGTVYVPVVAVEDFWPATVAEGILCGNRLRARATELANEGKKVALYEPSPLGNKLKIWPEPTQQGQPLYYQDPSQVDIVVSDRALDNVTPRGVFVTINYLKQFMVFTGSIVYWNMCWIGDELNLVSTQQGAILSAGFTMAIAKGLAYIAHWAGAQRWNGKKPDHQVEDDRSFRHVLSLSALTSNDLVVSGEPRITLAPAVIRTESGNWVTASCDSTDSFPDQISKNMEYFYILDTACEIKPETKLVEWGVCQAGCGTGPAVDVSLEVNAEYVTDTKIRAWVVTPSDGCMEDCTINNEWWVLLPAAWVKAAHNDSWLDGNTCPQPTGVGAQGPQNGDLCIKWAVGPNGDDFVIEGTPPPSAGGNFYDWPSGFNCYLTTPPVTPIDPP